MTISAPSTPSVSVSPNIFTTEICRFCGCSGDTCKVPEGQFGFRSCFWLDKEKTVCAAPICTYKWEQEKRSHLASLAHVPITHDPLSLMRRYRGLLARVSRQLQVSRSAVTQVAQGKTKSARISAALLAEVALIDQTTRPTA